MRPATRPVLVAVLLASLAPLAASAGPPAGSASAAPAGSAPRAKPGASALAATSASSAAGALPDGHPPVDPHGLPPGHPTTAQPADGGGGRFRAPLQSRAQEDPTLPPGTIEIDLRDGEDNPLPGREVALGIVKNSVAEGESRDRRTATTDDKGQARFSGLSQASSFAYRATVVRDGATYAAPPFNLPQSVGMRATLHAYPVTNDVNKASIAVQGIAYIELRDEVIQIEQAYRVYNLGGTTWLATDVQSTLPAGFKAFNAQKAMSDLTWDGTAQGTRFHGTISPGVHDTAYRFQIPYPSGDETTVDLGLLPHVQAFRVISDAPRGFELEVDGFPPAGPSTNGNGQRVLVAEKELPKLDPNFRRVHLRLINLPTKPRGRWYALALALAAAAVGIASAAGLKATRGPTPDELREARKRLLDELEKLEKDHAAGEVGPRTYEAARRALLDSLARLLQTPQSEP